MKLSIIKNNFSKVVGVAVWLLLWQIVALLENNVFIIPTPFETIKTLLTLLDDVVFLKSIVLTLFRVFTGFFLSVSFGVVFGVFSGISKWVHDIIKPVIVIFKATPVISVILMISIYVNSEVAPILIAFLMCFPIVWTNTYQGIIQTDHNLLEMAKCFNVSRKDVLWGIYLPSIRPYVVAGITMAIGISWKVTVAAEVFSYPKFAIGKKLYQSKIYVETPELFAWTFVVICLSFAFEYLVKYYLKKFESPGVAYDKN